MPPLYDTEDLPWVLQTVKFKNSKNWFWDYSEMHKFIVNEKIGMFGESPCTIHIYINIVISNAQTLESLWDGLNIINASEILSVCFFSVMEQIYGAG